jgi:undecaprenyl-diphosphatase
MSLHEIIILSFVQALTEFLPVSSSGHLIILPQLFGWQDQGLAMDVSVHVGTLCAVLVYFWRELRDMICQTLGYVFSGFQKNRFSASVRLSFVIVLATLPAVVIGYLLKKYSLVPRSTQVIAFTAIFFGIILFIADRLQARFHSEQQVGFKNGFLIGIAQAIALIPGTSRSGICITAGRFLGYDRISAARFAFLLSIPAIVGAATLTACDAIKDGIAILTPEVGIAVLSSFIFGLVAISFMLRFISRYSLLPFVIYRIALGIVLLTYF